MSPSAASERRTSIAARQRGPDGLPADRLAASGKPEPVRMPDPARGNDGHPHRPHRLPAAPAAGPRDAGDGDRKVRPEEGEDPFRHRKRHLRAHRSARVDQAGRNAQQRASSRRLPYATTPAGKIEGTAGDRGDRSPQQAPRARFRHGEGLSGGGQTPLRGASPPRRSTDQPSDPPVRESRAHPRRQVVRHHVDGPPAASSHAAGPNLNTSKNRNRRKSSEDGANPPGDAGRRQQHPRDLVDDHGPGVRTPRRGHLLPGGGDGNEEHRAQEEKMTHPPSARPVPEGQGDQGPRRPGGHGKPARAEPRGDGAQPSANPPVFPKTIDLYGAHVGYLLLYVNKTSFSNDGMTEPPETPGRPVPAADHAGGHRTRQGDEKRELLSRRPPRPAAGRHEDHPAVRGDPAARTGPFDRRHEERPPLPGRPAARRRETRRSWTSTGSCTCGARRGSSSFPNLQPDEVVSCPQGHHAGSGGDPGRRGAGAGPAAGEGDADLGEPGGLRPAHANS